jgi:type I restriction enzyme S subunit
MNNLKKYKLSSIIEIISGGTPKTNVPEYWNGSIPWLSVKDFNNGEKRVYNSEKYITNAGLEKSATTLLESKDIIISARGTVGEIAQIGMQMAFNQSCYGLRAKEKLVTPDFLYYLLKKEIIQIRQSAHGSVFDTITRDTFDNIEVNLPPLPTQRRIADILSALDDKIENNRKTSEKLEQIAQSIFKHWFVDFDFPDVQGRPYKSSGGKMIENELGLIPEGWKNISIKEISTIMDCLHSKKPEKKETGNLFIQVYNIDEKGWINFNDPFYINNNDYYNWISRMEIKAGDFVITKTGRVGAVGQMPRSFEAAMGRNMVGIRSKYSWFMRSYLLSDIINKQIKNLTNDGTIMPSLHVKAINKFSIIGQINIIKKYDEVISPIFKQQENILLENNNLQQTRDTLLPKLMSGEVEV